MDTITVKEYRELIKQNKYRNKKTTVNGIKFDSQAEADFYRYLFNLDVKHKRQHKFKLAVNNFLICYYYADFVIPIPGQADIVIDIKGFETRDFKIKRKLMKAIHGIDVICLKKNELKSWALLLKERQSPDCSKSSSFKTCSGL